MNENCAATVEEKVCAEDYKNHIASECDAMSRKVQELYTWCQMNYGFWTKDVDPFEGLAEIKGKLDALAQSMK